MRFQMRPGAPVFSEGLSTYADMLDPASSDERREAACRRLLTAVERQATIEAWKTEDRYVQERLPDRYGVEWKTTLHGAALETVAELLSNAIQEFEAATA
jgi:hypothetical protein